jgi:hypothetical protein
LTILSHLESPQFTPKWQLTHLNIALDLARLTSLFYLYVLAPTSVIPYWFYYPFNPCKPYVCECVYVCAGPSPEIRGPGAKYKMGL